MNLEEIRNKFTLDEVLNEIINSTDDDWDSVPSLEDRGEECPCYYYDKHGKLIKRICCCGGETSLRRSK